MDIKIADFFFVEQSLRFWRDVEFLYLLSVGFWNLVHKLEGVGTGKSAHTKWWVQSPTATAEYGSLFEGSSKISIAATWFQKDYGKTTASL
jgi:hypothetical protein